jgi:hypothetical protein
VSTIDLSHKAKEARSQRNGRGHRGSASVNNGTTNAAPTPIDDTNTTRLRNQLPWAPVLLNPQRLAFAAIGAVRPCGGLRNGPRRTPLTTGCPRERSFPPVEGAIWYAGAEIDRGSRPG